MSESRKFGDEPNLLNIIIESPENTVIVAPPQFGLTCLSLHMRVEAFKKRCFWLYIDASHVNERNVLKFINKQLLAYKKEVSEIKCIMIDHWDASITNHISIAKNIHSEYPDVPMMLFSNSAAFLDPRSGLANMGRTFRVLHLKALTRNAMRQLVSGYNDIQQIGTEDEVLSHMTSYMKSINIHRTPLNCLTLLRVHGSSFNEKLLNKTKLMKAILFVLFTDYDSFSYSNRKPDVDECTFVLGKYCKELVKHHTRSFDAFSFPDELKQICDKEHITLDVDGMIDALVDNNILIKYGSKIEFKHSCWIFYFAAEWMLHDDEFKTYILENRRYENFPEIIDFYSGTDSRRDDVVRILLTDLNLLVKEVDDKIGIKGAFNPLSNFLWNPSSKFVEEARLEIAEKVESSNLPSEIKDKHADKHYDTESPYDQSINKFLNDYSVLCLFRSISASSRALRNSTFVNSELKIELSNAILNAWEEISKVIFWISPLLAQNGRAAHDGFSLVLADSFSENLAERFKQILISNPMNVVNLLKDDLSSQKIGKLLYHYLEDDSSSLQKHFIALFLIGVRPVGWYDKLQNHLNRLHPSSYYLGDLLGSIKMEIELGFLEDNAESQLKKLAGVVLAKLRYSAKKALTKAIPPNMVLSDDNKLPIDQLLANHEPSSPLKYGSQFQRKTR